MTEQGCAASPPRWVRLWAGLVRRLPAGRYRLTNWLCRRPGLPFWSRSGAGSGAFDFVCDLRDGIAREVCFTQRYEPQETALLKGILRPGMTFVDVGANWGYFTLLAAGLVGPQGRVISLEPDPRLYSLLEANLERNHFGWARAYQAAAADAAGAMRLAGFDEAGGNWGLSRLTDRADCPSFEVSTLVLDDFLDALGVERVDVLKMDIEGAEGLALRGMTRGLASGRYRRVLLELHPALLAERGERVEGVLGLLAGAGYRLQRIDHSPAATRRAAYAADLPPEAFLTPCNAAGSCDDWPHLLCLAPE